MAKEKVNYQEVYDLYQLCSETRDLREFCADYGVNYDKFMNWQRHQLWSEKLGKKLLVVSNKMDKLEGEKLELDKFSHSCGSDSCEAESTEAESPLFISVPELFHKIFVGEL